MNNNAVKSGAPQISIIMVRGSLWIAIALLALLVIYDILNNSLVRARVWIACGVVVYLYLSLRLARGGKVKTANWMLIALYELLASIVLLYWGLESMVGILTASFAILLPGILMSPRNILGVTLITFVILITVYALHSSGFVIPQKYNAKSIPSILDVIAYCTILAVFALVSWLSSHQAFKSLKRALLAEDTVRHQKENLSIELQNQSHMLRQSQLQEIQQLYNFAIIGQSASATLHELANHLSVLNLDIDDLKQQHKNSKAIANAEVSMQSINSMVRKTRAQLNAHSSNQSFNATAVINQAIKDVELKITQQNIKLTKTLVRSRPSFIIHGDPLNLTQVISIILKNALDACRDSPNPTINISTKIVLSKLVIRIIDNGLGIDESIKTSLFEPHVSTKPSGLGVGLYIAKHLVHSQFGGTLKLIDSKEGTCFEIKIERLTTRK